jgi:hypothetical protein
MNYGCHRMNNTYNIFVPADSETTHREIERLKDLLRKAVADRQLLRDAIRKHRGADDTWQIRPADRLLWAVHLDAE